MSKSTTFTRCSGVLKRNALTPCICMIAPLMPLYRVQILVKIGRPPTVVTSLKMTLMNLKNHNENMETEVYLIN